MLKTILRLFLSLIIVTILAIGGLYLYNKDRTYFNKDTEITGNTAGNIYNGGVFCELDNKIYFSNDYADGSLYVMTSLLKNIQQVSVDKAVYINADENYIYYVRANDPKATNKKGLFVFYNSGVYRINQNGSNLKAISGKPGAYLILKGNNLYFQRYDADQGLNVYRYLIDGSEERLLVPDSVVPIGVSDNSLFYTGSSKSHSINTMSMDSYTEHTFIDGSFLYPIVTRKFIYYIDIADQYKIYRMNPDGTGKTLLVNKRCSTYNITNSELYLYYQVDNNTKKNGIYRINLETMKEEAIKKGNFKQINVTENYVFFKDYDNTNTYFVVAEGAKKVNKLDSLFPAE